MNRTPHVITESLHLPVGATGLPALGSPTAASSRPGRRVEAVDSGRLERAKLAYTTRFLAPLIGQHPGFTLITGEDVRPEVGQIVLARVAQIGHHTALPGPTGRRQTLFIDDEILVTYGHRYAPDQFEAFIPGGLTLVNLVAAGGLAAEVSVQHARMKEATVLEPLGLLGDADGPMTLERTAPRQVGPHRPRTPGVGPHVAIVFGSSMNSGKTTTVGNLVRGLSSAGLRVHAGKATGTGAWNDPGLLHDAGASVVLDFTDFGRPTTYRLAYDELKGIVGGLREALSEGDPDVVVIEIADGIFQDETARLVHDAQFAATADTVVFAAGEALGALAGVRELQRHGFPVKAVSGVVTASPLAAREAQAALDVPVVDTFGLSNPALAQSILAS